MMVDKVGITNLVRVLFIVYDRGNSMDWTPITSGHRCVLSMEQSSKLLNHLSKVRRIAHSLCQLSVGVPRLFNFFF